MTKPAVVAAALDELLRNAAESERLGRLGRQRVRAMFSAESVAIAYEREYVSARSSGPRMIGLTA